MLISTADIWLNMKYAPPFTVTPRSVTLVAQIVEEMGKSLPDLKKASPNLRRINRIRSIHSSLAIEGNTLSIEEVTDIIDGKRVLGNPREILEVKNAMSAYNLLDELDPYDTGSLLKAHGKMMQGIIEDAGIFRKAGVGVFSGDRLFHMAPPFDRVPELMSDLMGWAKECEDHPLIKSCVFHYEFEFIHPFSDGNGRTGRLWHTLILSKWNEALASIPIESMVRKHQEEYYNAISASTAKGDSGPFIEFMLSAILEAIEDSSIMNRIDAVQGINETERRLLHLIAENDFGTAAEASLLMGVSSRTVERSLSSLKNKGLIARDGSNKKGVWKLLIS